MDKSFLINRLKQSTSSYDFAKRFGISRGSLAYWCKKHDIIPRHYHMKREKYKCYECNISGRINFYKHNLYHCKKCFNIYTANRWKARKQKAITYKGGKCIYCGYDRFYGALDFHHRDPNEKEFNWEAMKRMPWEKTKSELDKCDLLCSNCHREEHGRLNGTFEVSSGLEPETQI